MLASKRADINLMELNSQNQNRILTKLQTINNKQINFNQKEEEAAAAAEEGKRHQVSKVI